MTSVQEKEFKLVYFASADLRKLDQFLEASAHL